MFDLYLIIFFILGLHMGSFFTVVGTRLPNHENFLNSRSYCDKCHHKLTLLDMVPLISFICLRGRCRYCKGKIDALSTYMEFFTGVLFALAYFKFGFSYDLLIALGIVSMLSIISVSDLSYYIIPDEVLVFFGAYFIIIKLFQVGVINTAWCILSGIALFAIMYGIMLLGNFVFKKETLGGGDIKMMLVFGIIISPLLGLVVIFLGSLLALPVSLFLLYKKHERLVPFGPFLLISLTFIYFTGLTTPMIINFIKLL